MLRNCVIVWRRERLGVGLMLVRRFGVGSVIEGFLWVFWKGFLKLVWRMLWMLSDLGWGGKGF